MDETHRTKALYETVIRRGPKAFKNLVKALNESENLQAAEILEPSHNGAHQIGISNSSPHFINSTTNNKANG